MEPGIIGSAIYTFNLDSEEYKRPTFASNLLRYGEDMIYELIDIKIEEDPIE